MVLWYTLMQTYVSTKWIHNEMEKSLSANRAGMTSMLSHLGRHTAGDESGF